MRPKEANENMAMQDCESCCFLCYEGGVSLCLIFCAWMLLCMPVCVNYRYPATGCFRRMNNLQPKQSVVKGTNFTGKATS